jgi:hypothetical protein
MKESEYIATTNLEKIGMARYLLRDIQISDDDEIIDWDARAKIITCLEGWHRGILRNLEIEGDR